MKKTYSNENVVFRYDVALGQHQHGTAGGVEVGEVFVLGLLYGERYVNFRNRCALGENDAHSVVFHEELAEVAREGDLQAVVRGGVSGEEGVEGEVVSRVPVVLPASEEGEAGDDVEFEALSGGGEGGGGDVTDVITVVDVRGLSGEDLSELEDGGGAASRVSLEVDAGEVVLNFNVTIIQYLQHFIINGNIYKERGMGIKER